MKSLRMAALMFGMVAVSMSASMAFAQQEVDPDHFDQVFQPTQKTATAQPQKHATSAAKAKRSLASAKHHRTRTAA